MNGNVRKRMKFLGEKRRIKGGRERKQEERKREKRGEEKTEGESAFTMRKRGKERKEI